MKNITLSTLMMLSFFTHANNQCDILAAVPNEKGNPASIGVRWSDLKALEAIVACKEAVSKEPTNLRYQFQLGRAYYKNKDYPNAKLLGSPKK